MQATHILAVLIISATYSWQCGGHWLPVLVVIVSALVLLLKLSNSNGSGTSEKTPMGNDFQPHPEETLHNGLIRSIPQHPHVQGAFEPSNGLVISNSSKPDEFENANCKGKYLFLHRPTYDKALDKSGDYPYSGHFQGKKRVWENRLQLSFKDTPQGEMFFGIELEDYVPMSTATKAAMKGIIKVLRPTVGDALYHSVGDDPKKVKGEREKPAFMMPFWAFDQIIVTPEGEEPPSLTDPNFAKLGSLRVGRVKAFQKEIAELNIRPGPTYTLAFYGISRSLDNIKWQVKVPMMSVNFNDLCGQPPVRVSIYTLKESENKDDRRHLTSRKKYYFSIAFWSSMKPPPPDKVRKLVGDEHYLKANGAQAPRKRGGLAAALTAWFMCCTQPRSHID